MPIEILMPALSPTMKEGKIVKWCKKEGDGISSGDLIAEVETDKAVMEVEAVDEGTLSKILIQAGQNIAINTPIAIILAEGETEEDLSNFMNKASSKEAATPAYEEQKNINNIGSLAVDKNLAEGSSKLGIGDQNNSYQINKINNDNNGQDNNIASTAKTEGNEAYYREYSPTSSQASGRIIASLLAKKIAHGENLSLENIKGSGPRGRIVKEDVLETLRREKKLNINAINEASSSNSANDINRENESPSEIIEISTMRQVIAKRLVESKQNIPHFYLKTDCQLDKLLELRKELNILNEEAQQKKITINDFIIKASALAIRKIPEINSFWQNNQIENHNSNNNHNNKNGNSTNYIVKNKNIDVAVAVSIENGLITPIIKNADKKSLLTISAEIKNLSKRARENSLKPEEFQGGSFTISNMGMYNIKEFYAIINPPQSAILSVGTGEKRAIIINDNICIKTMVTLTLSCDHRLIDGATGAKFLNIIKDYLENPLGILL